MNKKFLVGARRDRVYYAVGPFQRGLGAMRFLRLVCILVFITAGALCQIILVQTMHPAALHVVAEAKAARERPPARAVAAMSSGAVLQSEPTDARAAMSEEPSSGAVLQSQPTHARAAMSEEPSSGAVLQSQPMLAAVSGAPSSSVVFKSRPTLALAAVSDVPSSGVLSQSEPALAFAAASEMPSSGALSADELSLGALSQFEPTLPLQRTAAVETADDEQTASIRSVSLGESDDGPPLSKLTYLAYYVYSELPPDPKPANVVLAALKDVPVGTPLQEIKRAADAFGLNFNFMKAVARIESDFDPKQRTGSYIGLFQLSRYEFREYGSGDITSPRDNAVAAAYKFVTEAAMFEWQTHKKPTFSDLYLIHQQGWQGAAEHVAHPDRLAWKSMCATDEGKEKGESWCKRAIWQNTLPAIKRVWKSVNNLTSGAFVSMWRQRVDSLSSRYAEAVTGDSTP
jgi:hypothetical protein